jgi:hypothetical protein
LERLANSADVEIVGGSEPADLVLRSPDETAIDTFVDVTLADGAVVVTVRESPEPVVWEALGRLVQSSFDR